VAAAARHHQGWGRSAAGAVCNAAHRLYPTHVAGKCFLGFPPFVLSFLFFILFFYLWGGYAARVCSLA
jgi:hypothetical protein